MRKDTTVHYPDHGTGDGNIADHPRSSTMQTLDQEYTKLMRQHEAFDQQSNDPSQPWTPETERVWLAHVNPLRNRMFEIAMEIVDIPARSDEDLRTKAKVLHELANGETGDVVHQLATALCADILRLKPH
jgi:hypothetical protein